MLVDGMPNRDILVGFPGRRDNAFNTGTISDNTGRLVCLVRSSPKTSVNNQHGRGLNTKWNWCHRWTFLGRYQRKNPVKHVSCKTGQPVPVLPLGELDGCLGHWAKGYANKDQEIQLCGSESDECTPRNSEWTWWRWMEHTFTRSV